MPPGWRLPMRALSMRLLAASTMVAAAAIVAPALAAAPGPGTFTRITTPAGPLIYRFNSNSGATNNLHVAGSTSNDVTSVDIDCMYHGPTGSLEVLNLGALPVVAGSFRGTVSIGSFTLSCRLRAVPTGYSTSDYLGSFAG